MYLYLVTCPLVQAMRVRTAAILSLLLVVLFDGVESIGCFKCTSVNGSEPKCEDTFNSTSRFYIPQCYAGRNGRSGLFPGTHCIKMKAYREDGYSIIVRDCVVDGGGTNSESEIGRESHCWMVEKVRFNDVLMEGCSLGCRTDGCNSAPYTTSQHTHGHVLLLVIMTYLYQAVT